MIHRSNENSDPAAGTIIVLNHGSGVTTTYMHLEFKSPTVAPGDRVVAGQMIGRVGRTGNTPRHGDTHLHFEVRLNGAAVNPQIYLPGR